MSKLSELPTNQLEAAVRLLQRRLQDEVALHGTFLVDTPVTKRLQRGMVRLNAELKLRELDETIAWLSEES